MDQLLTKFSGPGLPKSLSLRDRICPLITSFVRDLDYQHPVQCEKDALTRIMETRAADTGVPFLLGGDDHSHKCFNTGLISAMTMYPDHPLEVQAWIGILTWFTTLIDDTADQNRTDLERFQERFYTNEEQPTSLLQSFAEILRETYDHYDNVVANFIIASLLSFVTANVMEVRPEFTLLKPTKGGRNWPYYIRDKDGAPEAYTYMNWPKAHFPDISQFMEGIYDMSLYLNLTNDILSFYKEELVGETTNYVSLRAGYEGKDKLSALQGVITDCLGAYQRVSLVFKGRGVYDKGWHALAMGFIKFHVTNPRYRLDEFGL